MSLSRSAGRSRAPISCSSRSPLWWPSVSLTSLNRSRSRSTRATLRSGALRRQDRPGRAFVEEAAVRKAGQRVVQREVLVLGRLAAQLGRGAGDDPEEREVEQCQAAGEQQVEAQRVVRDRGGDRLVRQVELERAGGRARLGEAERRVDLEQLPEAAVVCVLGLAQIGDLGRGAARERRLELVRLRESLADDRVVAGVDDAAGVGSRP